MLLELSKWMITNLVVVVGLAFLGAYPPFMGADRAASRYHWRDVLAFAAMSVFFMFTAYPIDQGRQIDLRMVPLGLAGWMYGWPAAAFIGGVTLAVRFWMGGPGAYASLGVVAGCLAILPLFCGRPRTLLRVAFLGLSQAAVLYVVGQTLIIPLPLGLDRMGPYWLLIAGTFTLSAVLLNLAIEHVHEKRILQRSLAEELRWKEAVLELIPYGILVLDSGRRVMDSNGAARTLIHGTRVPEQILEHPEINSALREGRRISACRVTYPDPSGDRIVQVSAVPLKTGAVVGIENVTGVVNHERAEAHRDRLELLGQLAAMAAHEIKNPLTTIKGFLQLLERRPEFAEHHSAFTLLQGEVEQINRVVGDFLILSGQPTKASTMLFLDELLQEIIDVMKLQHPSSQVRVETTGARGAYLQADPQCLKQILKNLIANAYEAMPGGGDLLIGSAVAGGVVEITISDSGQGIAPDLLPLIFRPYLTTKETGTGLGLAISHKLASEMGGRLEVTSEPGMGCTFRLILPQYRPAAENEPPASVST